jgi:hypothetical protein
VGDDSLRAGNRKFILIFRLVQGIENGRRGSSIMACLDDQRRQADLHLKTSISPRIEVASPRDPRTLLLETPLISI